MKCPACTEKENALINQRLAAGSRLNRLIADVQERLVAAQEALAAEPYVVDVARERIFAIQSLLEEQARRMG